MIFLVGTQLSGATWLRDCFSHVCKVPLGQELHLLELHECISRHIKTYVHLNEDDARLASRSVSQAAWRSLLDSAKVGAEFDKATYPATSAHAIVRNDLHHRALGLAREVVPGAKTVVLIRDPRAVFNSTVRYLEKLQPGWGSKVDPIEFALTWQHQNTSWLNDSPTIYLKYEDLKMDFVATLSRVFLACEISCSLETFSTIVAREYAVDAVKSETRLARVDDFAVRLKMSAIEQIEEGTADLMKFLNYRRLSS